MNTLQPRPSRTAVARGFAASTDGAASPTAFTRRQRVERDIHATLGRIERLAHAGQNPGFPADLERRLRTAAHPFATAGTDLTLRGLIASQRDLSRLAREATRVKILEGAA